MRIQHGNAGNLCGSAKTVGNQGSNAENLGGNFRIAVESPYSSNGNDKFKE